MAMPGISWVLTNPVYAGINQLKSPLGDLKLSFKDSL
jgi:hypothetical protein